MHLLDTEKAQAVLFFSDEGVSKELRYPELEALLDGFVPIQEWSDTIQKAVYVEFNHQFCVVAAVFFVMEFNSEGHVDPSWNLPLTDMARTATKGPDLGAGPIHLACATHCPVAYFSKWLWDPDMQVKSSHFTQIKKALKRNRLGVHFKQTTTSDDKSAGASSGEMRQLEVKLSNQYEKELRDQMAQLLKDQRLRIATMSSDKENAVKDVRLEYTRKLEALQQQLAERDVALADAQQREQELRATIDGQVQKIEGLREYFEHKLQRYQHGGQDLPGALRMQYQTEADAKVAAAASELGELLKMKEVELSYRQEHEEHLQHEIEKLRQENKELLANGGDHLLEKLSRKGVNFVTYQPGAGHITIPLAEMAHFSESPRAFTAAYCGVSESHYSAWLKHYQSPVCCAPIAGGDRCAADVPRVVDPVKFVPGESEYCTQHARIKPSTGQPGAGDT